MCAKYVTISGGKGKVRANDKGIKKAIKKLKLKEFVANFVNDAVKESGTIDPESSYTFMDSIPEVAKDLENFLLEKFVLEY